MTVIDTLTAPYADRRSRAAARSLLLRREVLPPGAPLLERISLESNQRPVIPASFDKSSGAGTQGQTTGLWPLGPRFRGDDGVCGSISSESALAAPALDLRLVPTRRPSTVRSAAMGASLIFHLAIAASLVGLVAAPRSASAPAAIPVRLVFVDPAAAPQDSTAIRATPESPVPMPATVEPVPPLAPERPPPPKPRQRSPEQRQRASSLPSPPTPSVAQESSGSASPAVPAPMMLAPAEALPSHGMRPIEQPAPAYPGSARRQGIEGDVILQLSVDEAGKLISVSVARGSGHRALDEAAIAAVKLWRFEPAIVDGRPVAAVAELPVRFRLAGG